MTKLVQVAVAILIRPNGEYLLASRPNGKGWAGWWEFPGGKIESGETPENALIRESQEELGITPTQIQPWIKRRYDYPATHDAEAKTVLLHFFFVHAWQGELQAREGQQFAWQHPRTLNVSPVLPANAPIMQALSLPPVYAISNLQEMGEHTFLQALKQQLDQGLQLLQIRESQLDDAALAKLSEEVLQLCAPYDCRCLLNGSPEQALQIGYQGVHLNSQRLIALTQKPDNLLVGASCHNRVELAQAQSLQLHFAMLSPVLPTKSHPEATGLGWEQFGEMLNGLEIPVYALGGMHFEHASQAQSCGARGIAMQRVIWQKR
ncbi:Nudix family hydrolase [Methylophilus sp. VKM B-3414]|uniref:Nudix family hydrolase n=1 Tax=Methylophilus sp. VKM B-3414 TaxID=3076121 RepID=UPI0028C9FF95|nr:Nudix family hydrolase [Methylophilus sp. VKM B-3414]MDT7849433.1 Nudix family hydrolase [Methylophilus sp. VKM B-3414]